MAQVFTRAETINRLTGKGTGLTRPSDITSPDGGGKFSHDGTVLPFAGNTFICHIDKTSDAFAALTDLQSAIANGPTGQFFTYLPPSSFHMTVFSGVHGGAPWTDGCPADLDPATPLPAITQHFKTKLADHSSFDTCTIAPTDLFLGHSLTVVGNTPEDRTAIKGARETLQDLTQIKRPDFQTYRQHISLCYQFAWMSPAEAEIHLDYADEIYVRFAERVSTIDLGPIEYCTFQDMHHFEPICTVPSGP